MQGVTAQALEDALKTVGGFASMFPATQFPGPGLGGFLFCAPETRTHDLVHGDH